LHELDRKLRDAKEIYFENKEALIAQWKLSRKQATMKKHEEELNIRKEQDQGNCQQNLRKDLDQEKQQGKELQIKDQQEI